MENRRNQALADIAQSLGGGSCGREGLERCLERCLYATGGRWAELRVLAPATGTLHHRAGAGDAAAIDVLSGLSVHAGDTPLGLAAVTREPVSGEFPVLAGWVGAAGSVYSVPAAAQGLIHGCLTLGFEQGRELEPGETAFLRGVAGLLGMVLANEDYLRSLRRRSDSLALLHESPGVAPDHSLPDAARLVLERLTTLLGFDAGAVYLQDRNDAGTFRKIVGEPGWPELLAGAAPEALLRERLPVACAPSEAEALLGQTGLGGELLLLPLVDRGETLGFVAGRREEGAPPLEAEDLEASLVLAERGALSVAAARLWSRREQALQSAREADARFGHLLESAPDAMLIVDARGTILMVNSQTDSLFGYSREELIGGPVETLVPDRFRERHKGLREAYAANPRRRPMGLDIQLFGRRRDGVEIPVEISLSPLELGSGAAVLAAIRDVSHRVALEREREQLLASEREKAGQLLLLIREAHHRIKNNLQAVTDLLSLGVGAGGDSQLLRDSLDRVQAIALVHDLLSQDKDVRFVNARQVISRLVSMLIHNGELAGRGVDVRLDLPDYQMTSRRATTLALIVNELLSNAAKHAFRGGAAGVSELRVSLLDEGENLALVVRDSGPGLPAGFDPERDGNVGLDLVRTLVLRDLDGTLRLTSASGLVAEVRFSREDPSALERSFESKVSG